MAIPAYSSIYLSKTARSVGNMLHNAVLEFGYDGSDFLRMFIQSDIAEQIKNANPKYLAGKSGMELFTEVVEQTSDKHIEQRLTEAYSRSDVYWVGWALAHYQWYSGRSFRDILETISYEELLGLYNTLHEADINKFYDVLDMHFRDADSNLKQTRKRCGITQEQLAEASGVSINTIRAYERKAKDINKAQVDIVLKLADALKCGIADILD